nr:Crustin4 [Penaeus japonicus]UGN74323.1 crustin I-3 [Penaeus japonicus]
MHRLSILILAASFTLALTTSVLPAGKPCEDYCEIEERPNHYECCDRNPGRCPNLRPSCIRSSTIIPYCKYDIHCEKHEKCCEDACLSRKVCKPAEYN